MSSPLLPSDWARAVLAGPAFEPPYRGALEDELAWHLVKVLPETARLRSEVEHEFEDARGRSLLTSSLCVRVPTSLRLVAFELGQARGTVDHCMLLRRDARLLASGSVHSVIRLRGSDLMDQMHDALYLASVWDPGLFSERGRLNLRTLASPQARDMGDALRPESPSALVCYGDDPAGPSTARLHAVAEGRMPHLLVRRLSTDFPDVWRAYAS